MPMVTIVEFAFQMTLYKNLAFLCMYECLPKLSHAYNCMMVSNFPSNFDSS
jgi:hypothetical protein